MRNPVKMASLAVAMSVWMIVGAMSLPTLATEAAPDAAPAARVAADFQKLCAQRDVLVAALAGPGAAGGPVAV